MPSDGQLVHDATAPSTQRFFAVSGRDNTNGDVIVKAINSGAEGVSATLNVLGADRVAPTAPTTVLQSASPADNNSLDEPEKVVPVATVIKNAGRHSTTSSRLTRSRFCE